MMGVPVGELQRRMSAREFAEWQAFARLEPLPGSQNTGLLATIAAMVGNAIRDPKKSKPLSPADFLPELRSSASRGQSVEQMTAYLDIYRAAFTAKRGRK